MKIVQKVHPGSNTTSVIDISADTVVGNISDIKVWEFPTDVY